MRFEDGKPCLSTEAESILSHSIPELSVYSMHSILNARTEEWMGAPTETDVVDNNVLLESIVNDIFKNDVDDADGGEMSVDGDMKFALLLPIPSSLTLDDDHLLSQSDIDNYPVKMTQQQLLMLNAFSNRLTSLFNDITKYGVPVQVIQPHMTTLRRMIASSRDIQCRIQSFARKHPASESAFTTPESCGSILSMAELQNAEKERVRLQGELDALNDKLKFFSSEYQRITDLYLQEKEKNETSSESTQPRLEAL